MARNYSGRTARQAATLARSQISRTTMAEATLDLHESESESESEVQQPARKLARISATERLRATQNNEFSAEWYIAIDFGATFTTVAWYRRGISTEKILTIDNFPGEKQHYKTNNQIPTEVWYPRIDAQVTRSIEARDIRMRFGNEVHRVAEFEEIDDVRRVYDDADRVTLMKLLLDKTEYAQASKDRLRRTLQSLKAKGHIEKNEDVFFHFFREIFLALKSRLGHDFNDDSTVEVTFCVPVCYDPSAVACVGTQVELAMKSARFGTDGESPCNMFVVHEAEAQAMHALTQSANDLKRGDVFGLIDCGGATVDAGVYRIALTQPLRLGAEVHEAMGAMVGAADLNSKFRVMVRSILRKELYLEDRGDTLDDIISSELIFKFESDVKRRLRYKDTNAKFFFKIHDLRKSKSDPRILDRHLMLTYHDIWSIFKPSVKKIADMMEDAVQHARNAGYAINKMVIVGGFGDSPCLQQYLIKRRDRMIQRSHTPLQLCFTQPGVSATGVATGAILRAINKAGGPSRIPCQSIGVLRHIPCDFQASEYTAEVLGQPRSWSTQEQMEYVMNTIHWVVKKGTATLESVHTVTFTSVHCFQPEQTEWIVEELLWASQTCTLDFYQREHPNNAGNAVEIGAAEFDVSHMRQKIRATNRRAGDIVDQVVILVEMTVIDRNLEFTARWPATPDGQVIQGSRKFFSVASAFTPGTK